MCRDRKALVLEKTSFASNTSGSFAVKRSPRLRCSNRLALAKLSSSPPRGALQSPPDPAFRPNVFPLYDVRYRIHPGLSPDFPSRSLSLSPRTSLSRRTTTNETIFHRNRLKGGKELKEQRDQPYCAEASKRLVEPDGIEPTTSCLQSTRSPN